MKLLYSPLLSFLLFFPPLSLWAQDGEYNTQDGYVAEGYDVVAYFNNDTAVEGKEKYTVVYDSVKFKFRNEANKARFQKNPEKFIPEYGGWCAYGVAKGGGKHNVDPEAYLVREGELYLFYDNFLFDARKRWKKDPKRWKIRAEKNWSQ